MKVDRLAFLNALEEVTPGLDSKEIIELSNCFLFYRDHIVTFNDEIAISVPFELEFKNKGVESSGLLSVLRKIKAKTVSLKHIHSDLVVQSKKIKAGIPMLYDVHRPVDVDLKEEKFHKLPKTFKEGLKACKLAIAGDLSNIFGYVHIFDNIMEACNNHSAVRFELDKPVKKEMLLPCTVLDHLIKSNVSEYHLHNGWIHFLDTETQKTFSCRTVKEEFPNILPFFIQKGKNIQLPKELSEILDRSSIFSEDKNNAFVHVQLSEDECVLRSQNEKGWIEEKAEISSSRNLNFYIGVSHMKKVAGICTKAKLTKNTIRFKMENATYLVNLTKEK